MTCCDSQLEQHADVTGSRHTDDGARLARSNGREAEWRAGKPRAREPARPRAWEAVREVVEVAPAEQADVARARAHDCLAAALGEHHGQQLVVDVGVAARAHLRRAWRSAVPPVCRSIRPTRVEARAWLLLNGGWRDGRALTCMHAAGPRLAAAMSLFPQPGRRAPRQGSPTHARALNAADLARAQVRDRERAVAADRQQAALARRQCQV